MLVDESGLEGGEWTGVDETGLEMGECVGVGKTALEKGTGWEARLHFPTPLPRLTKISTPISLSNFSLPSVPTNWNLFLHV
jgi:hypothetical protein